MGKVRITETPEYWAPELVAKRAAVRKATQRKGAAREREIKTGMSPTLIANLMTLQGGCCAVCKGVLKTSQEVKADHCHDTRTPRGLLCQRCNIAEGMIKKTGMTPIEFAQKLEAYLANPPARIAELV